MGCIDADAGTVVEGGKVNKNGKRTRTFIRDESSWDGDDIGVGVHP